jgi:hypothetical protein
MSSGGWSAEHDRLAAGRAETFVELIGIEPMTSGLQSQRSPN